MFLHIPLFLQMAAAGDVLSSVSRWPPELAGHRRHGLCHLKQARFIPAFPHQLYANG
jgi:hypothetical protein